MKNNLRSTLARFLAGMAMVGLTSLGHAQTNSTDIPRVLSYQGQIRSNTGVPIEGLQNMTVRLYADSTGQQLVWQDEFSTPVQSGVFNILLGSQHPLPDASTFSGALWVGVTIGDAQELKPYTQLSASPYALTVANHSITADKMAMDYVGSISVNGQKVSEKGGTVNFQAANGLSLNFDPTTQAIILSGNGSNMASGKGDQTLSDVVHSLTGTANQVLVNGTYGVQKQDDITLTLPQNINTGASPTFAGLTLTSNASIGGTLGVTGATTTNGVTNTGDVSTGTLHSSGQATLNSASITNGATVGGTLGVSGATTTAGVTNSGLITTDSLHVTGGMTIIGSVHVAGGIDTLVSDGPIESGNTLIMNGTSTPRALSSDLDLSITTTSGSITVSPAVGGEFASASQLDMTSHNVINVRDPIAPQDAATKNYVQGLNASLTTSLSSEVTRATAAEGTLTTNLATETTNRINGQAVNTAAITAETTRAEGVEGTLTTNLATATSNLATVTSNLATETTNRTNGDATNATAITAETSRATGAEGTLTTNLATVTSNLATETTNRTNGDATNATAITAETSRATGAEGTLTTNLATVTSNLATETTNRTNGDATNATAITAETSRATGAEGTLTTNLNTEVTRAEAAEAASMKTWVTVPASSSAAGTPGSLAQDANYLYICIATNTWKRVALSTW